MRFRTSNHHYLEMRTPLFPLPSAGSPEQPSGKPLSTVVVHNKKHVGMDEENFFSNFLL